MKNITRFIASAAICAFAGLAQAESPAPGTDRASTVPMASGSRAWSMGAGPASQAEAPAKIGNGGTGFGGVSHSAVSSQQLREEAAAAVRAGTIPRGEM